MLSAACQQNNWHCARAYDIIMTKMQTKQHDTKGGYGNTPHNQ